MASSLLRSAGHVANYAGVALLPRVERAVSESSNESDEENYLDIYLKKHRNDVDLKLTDEELDQLIFKTLKIPRDNVTAISQGDLRYVEVRMNTDTSPWQNLRPVYVKEGLTTGGTMAAREHVAWIHLQGAPLRIKPDQVQALFSPFGEFTTGIKKMRNQPGPDMPENLVGLWNGKLKWCMKIKTDIPNFAYIDGRKCRVYYQGLTKLCTHCGQADQCPGGGNFHSCKENGGRRADLKQIWNSAREAAKAANRRKDESYAAVAQRHLAELRHQHEELVNEQHPMELEDNGEEDDQPLVSEKTARQPRSKQDKNKERAQQSEDVEIYKLPKDVDPEDVLGLILDALQMDRVNAGQHWRLYKIKDKCWLIRGLILAEREVLLSTNLKLGRAVILTRPSILPIDKEIFENQTGELPQWNIGPQHDPRVNPELAEMPDNYAMGEEQEERIMMPGDFPELRPISTATAPSPITIPINTIANISHLAISPVLYCVVCVLLSKDDASS